MELLNILIEVAGPTTGQGLAGLGAGAAAIGAGIGVGTIGKGALEAWHANQSLRTIFVQI